MRVVGLKEDIVASGKAGVPQVLGFGKIMRLVNAGRQGSHKQENDRQGDQALKAYQPEMGSVGRYGCGWHDRGALPSRPEKHC